MKSLLIFALFAFLAVANCSDFLFCNYTATGCSSSDIQFCSFGSFGVCAPATNSENIIVTGNATTGGNVLLYAPNTCYTQPSSPIQNTTWSSFGACVTQGSSSYQVFTNTTILWLASTTFYSANSTCTGNPDAGLAYQTTYTCAPSNCTCGTYSCSKTIGCLTGNTAPALPNTFTYGAQTYTDSKCTELHSISGGAKSGVCIQTSATTSSQGAATCSTSSSVTNVFNTTGNCTGTIGSMTTINGSCSLGPGGLYYTFTCGSVTSTTTGATTTGATTTGASTTGATTTGASTTGATTGTSTTSNASPIFVHAAVILLSIFVLLGLFL